MNPKTEQLKKSQNVFENKRSKPAIKTPNLQGKIFESTKVFKTPY